MNFNSARDIPQLKALLATDQATVRDFLVTYQQENRNSELLVALDPDGNVVARTDTRDPAPIADAQDLWLAPGAAGVLMTEGEAYHAAAMPAEAGELIFGLVVAGTGINDAFARELRDISHSKVVIAGELVLGTTLAAATLPWQTRGEWEAAVGSGTGHEIIDIAGESYAAMATLLGREGGPRALAVVMQSQDQALAPYRRIQFGLVVLGLLAAAAGISGSAFLARSVTAPVAKLVDGTKQVASGNFDFRLDVRSNDEIGNLAQSFNTMTQGLRERADMQKFVPQSTVSMIQARDDSKVSSGERTSLTVFFTDIRGFTSMAERLALEEAVRILNRVLSLQADKVRKFKGDVDKFVGDSVAALFEGQDMELNAIRCAVEIHKGLEAYGREHPEDVPVRIGVGIVTGDVILGSIGSPERMDYTAIGSNVNLCARLCSMAGPRQILVDESTYSRVRDFIGAERLDPLDVKGFSEPVPVYRMSVSPDVTS